MILLQTIKCLLIVPNAESALNEEAGKLLLENYEEYYKRASMMTEIHAQVQNYCIYSLHIGLKEVFDHTVLDTQFVYINEVLVVDTYNKHRR